MSILGSASQRTFILTAKTTWTVLSGSGEYQLEKSGESQTISPGCVVVAHTGCVHGVFNGGNEPLVFISVVSPAEAGYELA